MLLREFKTDITIEKQILTAMIVSDKFMKELGSMIEPVFFENNYIKTITEWILIYYKAHEEAPKGVIKSIYDTKVYRKEIDKKQKKLIGDLLEELSSLFENQESFNHEYYIRTAEEYFEKRNLTLTAQSILHLVDANEINEAKNTLNNHHKIARNISGIFNPFDDNEIDQTFVEDGTEFFIFPGAWGEYCGVLERGHLVGISGPFKRGKTWIVQEFVVHAMLQMRKTLFVSLEMSKKQIKQRLYKRLTVTTNQETYTLPVFDCTWNQRDICELVERVDNGFGGPIVDDKNRTLRYNKDQFDGYKVCTFCRNNPNMRGNYHPSIWYEEIIRPEYEHPYIYKKLKSFKLYKQFIRYKTFPRFDANVEDIMRLIDTLENSEQFVPDVIIIDYPDILKPEDERNVGYDKEDRTWIALARLASKRNALVVVPTQVNKEGQTAKSLKAKHQAKWVGKLAHVDAMYTLNQTPYEKRRGIMRFGTMAHRHKDFDENQDVTILQNLAFGQAHLDSEIIIPLRDDRSGEEPEGEEE